MNQFEKEDLKQIRNMFKMDSVEELNFGAFKIREEFYTPELINTDTDEVIIEFDDLADISLDILNICYSILNNPNPPENFDNNWIFIEQEEFPAWKTPLNRERVHVTPRGSRYNKWLAKYPYLEEDTLLSNSAESYASSLVYVVIYLNKYNAYEIDYTLKLQEIAREKFEELPGIGSRTAGKLIGNHIYSYSELLKNSFQISKHQNKAEEILKKKIENGEEISDHPELNKIKEKATLENL